jgi:glycosyltransferase involved in cell wall biosynthesis
MSTSPIITGVICTHNRERFLERCILSLFDQSLDRSLYEVVVVDNGSTDRTREICDKYIQFPYFKYLHEPVLGLSSARNCGWKNARGKYVGYLDDDAIAQKTWFEKALWSFENIDPVPDWVGGPIDLEWEVQPPTWMNNELWVALGYVNWGNERRFLSASGERLGGGNSFYLKSILEKMHGFDTRLGRKKNLLLSGEETQFQHRLKTLGGRLYYHPGIRIFHYVTRERTKPAFFYRRYYWGGVTDYIMSKTLHDLPFEHIAQPEENGSQMGRLVANGIRALGVFYPEEKRIQSRIYMSYVLGRLVAVVKYGWRKIA